MWQTVQVVAFLTQPPLAMYCFSSSFAVKGRGQEKCYWLICRLTSGTRCRQLRWVDTISIPLLLNNYPSLVSLAPKQNEKKRPALKSDESIIVFSRG